MPGKLELIASSIIPIALGIIGYRMHLQVSREASVTTLSTLPNASWPNAYDRVRRGMVQFSILTFSFQYVWGNHRPNLYFGLRTKHPLSPLFGVLWYNQPREPVVRSLPMRHWCDHGTFQ